MGVPPQMQYRPRQARQIQFPSVSGPSQPQELYCYPQTTVYPMGTPSPPADMTGIAQFQTTVIAQDIKSENRETEDSEREDGEMEQYSPQQVTQGQFTTLYGPSQPQGLYCYLRTTVYPTGQPSPPVYIVRASTPPMIGIAPFQTTVIAQDSESENRETEDSEKEDSESEDSEMEQYSPQQEIMGQFTTLAADAAPVVRAPTALMTGMPQFQTQNFDPREQERDMIQIKDAELSASPRTSPLSSQRQAEANVRAQFQAQVAATLANDSESEGSKSEMEQYRPQQATQGQFTMLAADAAPVGRAPTGPMTGMPQFQTQNFEPRARDRNIIQIKDAEQSASLRTSFLSSQQQPEVNVRAQFAAQVAATLAKDSEREGSKSKWSKMEEYRREQATQGQFTTLASRAAHIVRAPFGPMTGMPQFQTQNFEPLPQRRKILQIKDAKQSASSRTSPLSSQQQAEADVRAQFAAQVAAALAKDSEREGSKSEGSEIEQYRPHQATRSQFTMLAANAAPIVRAPTAPMSGMPQFQARTFEPCAQEKNIIQIKDAEQSARLTTSLLSSQQQAEVNVRAQFAAQVAATLAKDSESEGSKSENEQDRPEQATQGQFTTLAANAASVVRAPTGPMTGMPQFRTQIFEPHAQKRNIIQIKDAEQSASSRTSLSSQQQAEAKVRAQFAVQVAAALAKDSEREDVEMGQYRPQQASQGQFTTLAANAASVVRAPTGPMTGMPQFQTQTFKPHARKRNIIQIKDAEQSASSKTSLSSQQQAEADVRAQFAAQVAAALAKDSEREDVEMEQYRPQQASQGQFTTPAANATSVVRAPIGPMTGMPQFQTQTFEPHARKRNMIQIKDAEQSASSKTSLSSQQQAEGDMGAQFAVQVTSALAKDSKREGSKSEGSEMEQYRPWQAMQSQFTTLATNAASVVRAPTALMTGMPQFQTQTFEPRARKRNIIQIKDAEQSASSRTSLSSQQQAEAKVRAQFAVQVAAALAKDSEREEVEMEQYRPQQAMQGQFTTLATNAAPVVRAPTAPTTGMSQFQTQNFEPHAQNRNIILIEDAEQSASSRTSLSSQQQAEADVRAQFAAQVAAALAMDSEREGSKSEGSEMEQCRPQQATQSQFTMLATNAAPVVRAPTALMTGMPQFQTQMFEFHARKRNIIQIKDAEQSASSRTSLSSQQQAEVKVRAQFAAQVAAALAMDSEKEGSKSEGSEMEQYRPHQATQSQFTTLATNATPVVRAPMTGIRHFRTQTFEPRPQKRSVIQIKDAEQSAYSRTSLSSKQQAAAKVRAQFAAQVAAALAMDREREGSKSKGSEMEQYRPQQAMQGQFTTLATNAAPVVRAPTAPVTGIPHFQTQTFEPRPQKRSIIEIKDAEQSANSRTSLSSQQQAEADVRAQFAAQVAAALAMDREREGSKSEGSEMEQYRPQQATQGQFTTLATNAAPVVRAPTAPMTGIPHFRTQTFEPRPQKRSIIEIKDAEQSANSRTSLSSQQQAEAKVRAQFAAQVAAALAMDSEREGSKSEGSEMEQYRPQQAMQGQFTTLATNAAPVVRAPTAPMTGMPQFQTQNFEPRTQERNIIHIKDAKQSASLRTSLSSQQQAEADVRAQFAAQVAAALAMDSKREGSKSEGSEMEQYRPQQTMQGQFTTLATNVAPVVRAPTALMTGMPQFQTQTFEPRARKRNIIPIEDAEQSANSRTSLSSQQQAEAKVRAQFAVQVAEALAKDSEREEVEMEQYRPQQATQGQFTMLATNAAPVEIDVESQHEGATKSLKNAELSHFRDTTDGKVTEEVDQQVAKPKSAAEASEVEAFPVTVLGVKNVTGYESHIEMYGVTMNPNDTHRTGLY